MDVATKRSGRPWLTDDDLAPALIVIALAALACLTPVKNDTFWHLRSGQEMWQTGRWLTAEPFSFTAAGRELHNHWWLSQLAFYGIHAAGGSRLLTLVAGACALAATLWAWRSVRGPWELRLGLLVLLAFLIVPGWGIRPSAFSLLFVVVLARLMAQGRLAWLPLVCLVWANVHGLVVLGVAMTAALVIEAIVWSRAELTRAIAVCGLCAAAPMVSPPGLDYWPQVVTTVTLSRSLDLVEYRAPFDLADWPFWLAVTALAGLFAMRWTTLPAYPRPERVLIVAALVLAAASVTAARNVSLFALVAVPALSWLWAPQAQAPRRRGRRAPAAAYAIVAVALTAAAVIVGAQWQGVDWQSGRGAGDWQPLGAELVEAVRACPEPAFNRFDDGGFLMWALPDRPVFVDSRIEAYPADVLHLSRAADVEGDYEEPFGRYGINCAIVGIPSPMETRLRADPRFALSYADATRAVFVRTAPAR